MLIGCMRYRQAQEELSRVFRKEDFGEMRVVKNIIKLTSQNLKIFGTMAILLRELIKMDLLCAGDLTLH